MNEIFWVKSPVYQYPLNVLGLFSTLVYKLFSIVSLKELSEYKATWYDLELNRAGRQIIQVPYSRQKVFDEKLKCNCHEKHAKIMRNSSWETVWFSSQNYPLIIARLSNSTCRVCRQYSNILDKAVIKRSEVQNLNMEKREKIVIISTVYWS